jgi:hypothetical protein
MKNRSNHAYRRILFVALMGLIVAATAPAATLNLNSDLVNEGNNITGTNVYINPHPAWQPNGLGKWISYANTGEPGTVSPPNQSDINGTPTAIFHEDFVLGGIGNGSFTVWADDTTRVLLVGPGGEDLLKEANPVQDGACASGPIACQPLEGFTINLTNLIAGNYTIEFETYQRGGGPFGLMYEGSISYDEGQTGVPEPGTYALMGAGLLGLGFLRRKK